MAPEIHLVRKLDLHTADADYQPVIAFLDARAAAEHAHRLEQDDKNDQAVAGRSQHHLYTPQAVPVLASNDPIVEREIHLIHRHYLLGIDDAPRPVAAIVNPDTAAEHVHYLEKDARNVADTTGRPQPYGYSTERVPLRTAGRPMRHTVHFALQRLARDQHLAEDCPAQSRDQWDYEARLQDGVTFRETPYGLEVHVQTSRSYDKLLTLWEQARAETTARWQTARDA